MKINFVFIICLLIILSPWVLQAQENVWVAKSRLPGSTYFSPAFTIGNKGYIRSTGFWEFDPASNSWTEKANLENNSLSEGFSIGNKGYLCMDGDANKQNELWEYDQALNQWTKKKSLPATGRNTTVAFSINGKGYLVGGFDLGIYFKDVWEYDPTMNDWTRKNDAPSMTGESFVISSLSKGYVVTSDGSLIEYNPSNDSWNSKARYPGTAFRGSAFSIGDRGYFGLGEMKGQYANKLFFEYNPFENAWTKIADFGGGDRTMATAFSIGGKGYVGGGQRGAGYYSDQSPNDFWEYTPELQVITGLKEERRSVSLVFPNPFENSFELRLEEDHQNFQNYSFVILNVLGQVVYNCSDAELSNKIDFSEKPNGLYFLILKRDNEIIDYRLRKGR
jgi:hypothetical protein